MNNAKSNFTDELKSRLEKTTIEQDDALKIIKRYDCPDAFHFIDPPYVGSDMGHYKGTFGEENLFALLRLLVNVQGKFMLTMYPNDTIKQFADGNGWKIIDVERQISACKASSRRKQTEWIVVNYSPEKTSSQTALKVAA